MSRSFSRESRFSDSPTGGNFTVTKTGRGILTFSGSNTYGGQTLVTEGVLQVNNPTGQQTRRIEFTFSAQFSARFDTETRAMWSRWTADPRPCFNPSLLADIRAAKQSVHFETYLWKEGVLGQALVSPRSAKEYGLATNAANGGEMPETLELAPGESTNQVLAALDTGLSGPSRLHDLFVTCEAMTPGDYKRRGEGLEITYGFHASPFGDALDQLQEHRGKITKAMVLDRFRSHRRFRDGGPLWPGRRDHHAAERHDPVRRRIRRWRSRWIAR